MNHRREFMKTVGSALGVAAISLSSYENLKAALIDAKDVNPNDLAKEEDFWRWVRSCYTVSYGMINLNNGGVSPQPKIVQDAHIRYYELCNEAPSYYMWRTLDQNREPLRQDLANFAGVSSNEIAINRNSTEGLNSVIFGLNLKKGDEIVLTKQDYPNMINAWKQREKRDGIKLVWLNLDMPNEDENAIVSAFANAFTDKTKIVHITHIINWNGQILPAKKIAAEAHKRGIEVLVDGAHSFAHLNYQIPDLDCDYYATSLHKWLSAPFGSGMLYIKKDKIKNVWALLSAGEPDGSDIRKFESLGTRSFASEMAIATALDFHLTIGSERKQARLHYLKSYWTERALENPKVKMNTSLNPNFSCAIANFRIEGKTAAEVDTELLSKHKIHTVAIDWENIKGVRVTPHVYTNTKDLDKLVKGIKSIAG